MCSADSRVAYMPSVTGWLRGIIQADAQGTNLPGLNGCTWDGYAVVDCEEGYPCLLKLGTCADKRKFVPMATNGKFNLVAYGLKGVAPGWLRHPTGKVLAALFFQDCVIVESDVAEDNYRRTLRWDDPSACWGMWEFCLSTKDQP